MKYASVIKRKKSPFWYIAYWSPLTKRRKQEATAFRTDEPGGYDKARALARERSSQGMSEKDSGGHDRWGQWVDDFLRQRYLGSGQEKSYVRMNGAWKQWRRFLEENEIRVPRALRHQDVMEFLRWRTSQVKPASQKRVSHNTALVDIRCMSVVLGEAVRREYCSSVVTKNLGIKKKAPKEKVAMTDREIAMIREALTQRPEWMRVSFEIAIHQGCRLSETSLPLSLVDTANMTISFHGKGGKDFATQLHPGLVPLMEGLIRRGLNKTCELPRMAAKEWHFFFKEIGLPHLCFHSTRVTVVTRLAKAGVCQQQAKAYVGHASTAIHKVYTKLRPSDLGSAVTALSALAAPVPPLPRSASLETGPTMQVNNASTVISALAGANLDLTKMSAADLLKAIVMLQGQPTSQTCATSDSSVDRSSCGVVVKR